MSKNTKTEKKPLSQKAQLTIAIAIILVVAIVATIFGVNFVKEQSKLTPDSESSGSTGSSSLTISNGDFMYADEDSIGYPHTAQDWDLKTYKDGSTFGTIETDEKVIMGIINTADWDALSESSYSSILANIQNPGVYGDEAIDKEAVEDDEIDVANVYMIHAKESTTASIMSKNFSVSSMSSAKITVWLNTAQLADGSKATVMLQNSSGNAQQTSNKDGTGTQYWYAYDFEIEKVVTTENNGWEKHEFFIFNRSSSSKTVKCNIGLGNSYNGTAAEGTLFIDNVTFETVTANEYRKHFEDSANNITTSYIINATDKDNSVTETLDWTNVGTALTVTDFLNEGAASIDGEQYSPFVATDTFNLYKVDTANSVNLVKNIDGTDNLGPDYVHIYFWLRVVDGTALPQADLVDITVKDNLTDKEISSKTKIVAVEDITTDTNCGWQQYHIYVKPDKDATTAEISITVDWNIDIATEAHDGEFFISQAMFEFITDDQYTNASSSTYNLKADMSITHASTGATNGSFGQVLSVDKTQPSSWENVYAGANSLYGDGKGNTDLGLDTSKTAFAGSGVANDTPADFDDASQSYLAVVNNNATSHGYLSSSVSLSAKSVYQVSVLAKGVPYIYVLNQKLAQGEDGSRESAVIAKFEGAQANSEGFDKLLNQTQQSATNGWVRYYFIIETSQDAITINIALFNGSIDGATKTTGTVLYDQVVVNKLGSYAVAEDTDVEDAQLYKVTYSANSNGYATFMKNFTDLDGNTTEVASVTFKDKEENVISADNVQFVRLATEDDWAEMRKIPVEEEEEDVEDDTDDTTSSIDIDWGLLLSVISSIALVAALLIVVVIKIIKRKKA